MTVLSFDQSSRITGYALFKDSTLVEVSKFEFSHDNIGERLVAIRNKVKTLIEDYTPDFVVIEDIQQQGNVANNIQTYKILAQVQGIIIELLTELHIPYTCIFATSWKSTLGIKGRARAEQKKNAQQYVLDHYNKKVTQDEADAVCIGAAYLASAKGAWTD